MSDPLSVAGAVIPALSAAAPAAPELWLPVPDWPGYEVSDRGRVRSVDRVLSDGRRAGGLMLTHGRDGKGRRRVHLSDGDRERTVHVHVLVAEAHISRRPAGMQVLHRDDDHERNDAASLSYGTARENVRERVRRERKQKREQVRKEKRRKKKEGKEGETGGIGQRG